MWLTGYKASVSQTVFSMHKGVESFVDYEPSLTYLPTLDFSMESTTVRHTRRH